MADDVSSGSPVESGDEAFQKAHERALLEFAKQFESWAATANAHGDAAHYVDPPMFTFSDFARRATDPAEIARRTEYYSRRFDLVWELAVQCRRYLLREINAWVTYLRRRRLSIDDAVELTTPWAKQRQAATRTQHWRAGLALVRFDYEERTWGNRVETLDWVQNAWTTAVEEAIEDYLANVLRPSLLDAEQSASRNRVRRRSSAHVEEVEDFIRRVMRDTGTVIRRTDVALLAGYHSLRELQSFQRNDKRLGATAIKNITRVLAMTSAEVAETLPKRRKELERRRKVH